MTVVKTIPKLLGAAAVLLVGPFIGVLIGLILAMLSLVSDPAFFRDGGHASLAGGILILLYIAISLVISVPMSIFGAGLLLFGSRNEQLQEASADSM